MAQKLITPENIMDYQQKTTSVATRARAYPYNSNVFMINHSPYRVNILYTPLNELSPPYTYQQTLNTQDEGQSSFKPKNVSTLRVIIYI